MFALVHRDVIPLERSLKDELQTYRAVNLTGASFTVRFREKSFPGGLLGKLVKARHDNSRLGLVHAYHTASMCFRGDASSFRILSTTACRISEANSSVPK